MASESIETADLVVFLAVARTGSLGGAAEQLGLSTPSVSARMSALERRMARGLFVRTSHGSPLTEAGERFAPYAERSLLLLQEARHAVRTDGRDRMIVGAPASLAAVLFPAVMRVLNTASLAAHCRVGHSKEVVGHLLDGIVDVGLVVNQVLPSNIVAHRLCRSPLLAVCSPKHPLARQRSVSVDDLQGSVVVVYRWSPEAEALAEMFDNTHRPREHPVHLVGLPTAVLNLAVDESYVAVVPAFAVTESLATGTLVPLPLALPGWSLDVQLAYRASSGDQPGIRTLLSERGILTNLIAPVQEPEPATSATQ